MDKVRNFYSFSKNFETKFVFLFSTSASITSNFAFEVFIGKLKESIIYAVDVILAENEEVLKKEWDQREQSDWNIVTYLKSYEALMEFYKVIQIHQAVRESYLELKAYVEQSVLNCKNGSRISWVKSFLAEQSRWPGMTLNESLISKNRDSILSEKQKLTFLDLQNLIFANIFFQYLRDASSVDKLFSVTLDFVTFTQTVLKTVLVPSKATSPHAIDCWAFVTVLSVLLYCKNEAKVNLFDFPEYTIRLWEVARIALENLGTATGLYSKEKQSSDKIQAGLDIMAGVEQSDECIASLQLRKALSSKSNYDEKFEELITMAISTCKHKGWKRNACWKTVQLADFLMANGKLELAAKHYSDSVAVYTNELWPSIEVLIRSKIVQCQQHDKNVSIDAINVLASALNKETTNSSDPKGVRMSAIFNGLSPKSEITSPFLSENGIRIISFTAVDDATAAPACAEQQQQQLGAGVTGATVVADLKLFDLVLDSLFPSELIGAVVKWYYASFDEDYRLGYVRSSHLRFLRPEQVIERSQASTKQDSVGTTKSSQAAGSVINAIENRFTKGGEGVFTIKPGKHKYRVGGEFRTAGLYQFKKISCIMGNVRMDIVPPKSIDFHIHNIAPKVSVMEATKPIHSHVKTKVSVVAEPSEWPTSPTYHLEMCSCPTATVKVLTESVVLGGESSEQKELEIELEVFTSILTDFHHVCFHWVVHPSQISLTSNCQVPSKRPLTIVPELLPAIQPPIMLLTARNGSNAELELTEFQLQHRPSVKAEWAKVGEVECLTKTYSNVNLCGPTDSDKAVKILGQCKACWSTAPASLPISNELRLSCQYKTEDFNQNSISWCSIFTARTLTSSSKCQYMWMSVQKEFYQFPTGSKSAPDFNVKSAVAIDLFSEELRQGKKYLFSFKASLLRNRKKSKFLYWVPSSAQWGMTGTNSRGSLDLDLPINIEVTARKPGDDIALPEVVIRDDSDITTPLDIVDTSEFRRVKVVPRRSTADTEKGGLLKPPSTPGGNTSPSSIVLRPSIRAHSPGNVS